MSTWPKNMFKTIRFLSPCPFCRIMAFNGIVSVHFSDNPAKRGISTGVPLYKKRKRDFYRVHNLPIYDYGKIHPDKKRLYVFGSAGHGGLGLQNLLRPTEEHHKRMLYMHRPVRHTFGDLHRVKDIAVGHGFSLISIKPKQGTNYLVFGCGNNTKSQLGYQPDERDKSLAILISIVPLPLPLDKTSNVLTIGAGRGHSVISVEGKGLLTLGDNSVGQCGRNIIEDEEYRGSKFVCRIPPFGSTNDYDVVQIASKFDTNVCLTRMGTVYTFGLNQLGQLGRGKFVTKPWLAEQAEGDLKGQKIIKVVTSGSSVLALAENGKLFGWGTNDCGQIDPNTNSNNYYDPVYIKLPRRIGKVIDVALGEMFTLILNEFGHVYVWGHGISLGLGPSKLVVRTPTLMPPPLFGRNEFSPDVSVVKVFATSTFAAAVNSIGDLFTWGKNTEGCLGLGQIDFEYQFFPLKVQMAVPVEKVGLGADHVVLTAKSG